MVGDGLSGLGYSKGYWLRGRSWAKAKNVWDSSCGFCLGV